MVTRLKVVSRSDALHEGIRFLATFLIVAAALLFLFTPMESWLQQLEAGQTQSLLHALGVPTSPAQNPTQFWMNGKLIEISPLCSGLLEMILLASAIIVTPSASVRKKVVGLVIGIFILYVFNLFRMGVTLLQLEHASFSFAEITHDILFRVILIVGFALLYAVWLNFSSMKKKFVLRGMV
ncbi:MAG: exosortase/archaeosortase family protein [archaeon]|mgnify:CR=1 FL=1